MNIGFEQNRPVLGESFATLPVSQLIAEKQPIIRLVTYPPAERKLPPNARNHVKVRALFGSPIRAKVGTTGN